MMRQAILGSMFGIFLGLPRSPLIDLAPTAPKRLLAQKRRTCLVTRVFHKGSGQRYSCLLHNYTTKLLRIRGPFYSALKQLLSLTRNKWKLSKLWDQCYRYYDNHSIFHDSSSGSHSHSLPSPWSVDQPPQGTPVRHPIPSVDTPPGVKVCYLTVIIRKPGRSKSQLETSTLFGLLFLRDWLCQLVM